MSTRASLQSYQEQLAQRLADTERTGRTADWLALRLAGHDLLLPLAQSGEIHPPAILQRLPLSAPWVLGVTGLRGTLTLVVDLARWWGWKPNVASPAHSAGSLKWVGGHPSLGVAFVFPVEQLRGLRHRSEFTPSDGPLDTSPAQNPAGLGTRWTDPQGQSWREIDLQALTRSPEFMDIRARGLAEPTQRFAPQETPHA